MNIERYDFGTITIEGATYTSDVIIYAKEVDASWWRAEGHNVAVEDIRRIASAKPGKLVIGTGYYGRMGVSEETLKWLAAHNIQVEIAKTGDAVKLFNRLQQEAASVVAALHLTC
ncbi:MAG: hypothetical protein HYU77_18130 [Betaproteobacteria bacterium]|nr:hypothetical protein [Betaproteobacteria bacterium]